MTYRIIRFIAPASAMLVLLMAEGFAQGTARTQRGIVDSTAAAYELDLAPPRSPAFSLVDVEAESILRPSTAHELVTSFSTFSDSAGGFKMPSAFGVEFSPALLIAGPRLTLKEYQEMPFLYRLQLSVSARQAEDDGTGPEVAVGLRIPIIDGSDKRTDRILLTRNQAILDQINAVYVAYALTVPPTMNSTSNSAPQLDEEHEEMVDDLMDQLRTLSTDTVWNDEKLEVAVAAKGRARDDQGHDLRLAQYAIWGTYGMPIGDGGQLLVGINAITEREPITERFLARGTFGARLETGTNWITMFAEGGVSDFEGAKRYQTTLNFGLDVYLGIEGVWVSISAGGRYDGDSKTTSLETNADIKYNTISLWRMLSDQK